MSNWTMLLIVGILSIILGIVALFNPQFAGMSLAVLLGISFLVIGVATILLGFTGPTGASIFWSLLLGLLMALTGWAMISNPLDSLYGVEIIVAILMIAQGVVMLVAAFSVDMGVNRWWAVAGGIASFVLAYFLFTQPGSLGFLVGLQLIFDGVGISAFALAIRRTKSIYYS